MTLTAPPDIFGSKDQYETPLVGDWAEEKGRLLWYYCDLFATSMKGKWAERVYIDLFAGAGKVQVRETSKVIRGSPLLALVVRSPFDRYIFCEEEPILLDALKRRVETEHPTSNVRFVAGDVNSHPEKVLAEMPPYSASRKVLGFCFADPFRLQNLKFSTIDALAKRFMDFLIHIPAMDPQRAWQHYQDPKNHTVDDFLGTVEWRVDWEQKRTGQSLDVFIGWFLDKQMRERGFRYGGIHDAVLVRSTAKNAPLYRLGFFSKSSLGAQFWSEAKKYTSPQRKLF
jgi:three-Cys-motif partner protein